MYAFTNEVASRFGVEPSTVVSAMLIGGACLYVVIVLIIILERHEERAIGAARERARQANRPVTQGDLRSPPEETEVAHSTK